MLGKRQGGLGHTCTVIGVAMVDVARKSSGPRGWGRLVLVLYTVVGVVLSPAWWAFLQIRSRTRLGGWARLGGGLSRGDGPRRLGARGRRVCFHAASAGDVVAVAPVLARMAALCPQASFSLTVQTRSGQAMAGRLLSPQVEVGALPLDVWPWMDLYVARRAPDLLVLEYLELWPRLLWSVRQRGGQVALLNARVHPRRMATYLSRWGALWRGCCAELSWCFPRSAGDAERLRLLGASCAEAGVHTKYALLEVPEAAQVAAVAARHGLSPGLRSTTWIAAAVHVDEVACVLAAHAWVGARRSGLRLLLCPRYPEKGALMAQQAARLGLRLRRRYCDDAASGPGPGAPGAPGAGPGEGAAEVVLIESVGELRYLYGLASVALIGGTLGRRGGQNPVEGAIAGCTLLVGPHCDQIAEELACLGEAVHEVTPAQLGPALLEGLEHPRNAQDAALCLQARAQRRVEDIAHALAAALG